VSEPYLPGMYAAAIKASLAELPDRLPRIGAPGAGPPPILSTRKAAQWQAATYGGYVDLARRTSDPEQRAELDRLLEQTIAAGPDFAKVRRNATFAPATGVAYSREAAAEIIRQAREIERGSYASRLKGAHGGALGRMALQLLEWFAFVIWPRTPYGMVPSLAHIAAGARMARATVVAAMKRLEAHGFLTVQRRRQRLATPLGVKIVQATSSYTLNVVSGLGALALAVFGRKPPLTAERPKGGSEFRRLPAIRNDGSFLRTAPPTDARKPGFRLILT
jgi:hypothetical protein